MGSNFDACIKADNKFVGPLGVILLRPKKIVFKAFLFCVWKASLAIYFAVSLNLITAISLSFGALAKIHLTIVKKLS